MGVVKIRQSPRKRSYLGSVAEVEKVRGELLKTGNDYINKDRRYKKLFELYLTKQRLSRSEALIRVAQIAGRGTPSRAITKLENEKPLRPVDKSSENLGENLRYRRRLKK